MKNKFLSILFALFIFPAILCAETLQQGAPSVSPASSQDASASLIEEAARLEKSSKWEEAREAYQSLLKKKTLSAEKAKKVRQKIEKLNIKILFSPDPMPETVTHEVVVGDSLYKIAKKYHTTIELIKKSNRLEKDTVILGQKLKVLNNGEFSIYVDKSRNVLTLSLNGKPFKHYRVATGLEGGTPEGDFKIINKIENPTWYKTGAVVPPGDPKNYLGTRWLGIDSPGYGIHGTTEPESIGHQSTSGCVRMHNKEVEELYIMVPLGTPVKIVE